MNIEIASSQNNVINKVVVRLKTSAWSDGKGIHIKRSLTYLRRQCAGFNGLEEDAMMAGAEQAIKNIINLSDCNDGVYEVVMCNVSKDFETGYADDWDYKLVPVLDA